MYPHISHAKIYTFTLTNIYVCIFIIINCICINSLTKSRSQCAYQPTTKIIIQ